MGLVLHSLAFAVYPLLFIYLIIPALIFFIPGVMQHAFFLSFVKLPFTDYSNLTAHHVNSRGRNFYIVEDTASLGLWHILPAELSARYAHVALTDIEMETMIGSEKYSTVVYLHGNSFDRAQSHRCELYNVLSSMNVHVIAVDYRGYGDSTGSPTEIGIVEDAKQAFLYAKSKAGNNAVYLYGHSMGTGVAAKVAMDLSMEERAPSGLILESPFNNLRDVVLNHPFSLPFRWLPWFDNILIRPMQRGGLNMSSDERITKVECPILILHAKDDHIIPSRLGQKLKLAAEEANRDVTLVEFAAERRFRHKYICRAEELPSLLSAFFAKCSAASLS